MNYTESLEYIHSVSWMGSRPGLSRTAELLEKIGNPHLGLKFLHVTGTNGKGSTCAMCDSVLRRAGYKVGLYTSPFVVRFNERITVDGEPIPDSELAELTTFVRPFADSMEDKPTEFELITAIAFLCFARRGCDIVVLEVGMGGRLDSTNVIPSPVASVITGVAIDHSAVLGNTVESIAYEKAGIIKEGCAVIYGGRDDSAFSVISKRAKELGCNTVRTELDSLCCKHIGTDGTVFDYKGMKDVRLSLCGSYQPENAATAIEAIGVLSQNGFPVTEQQLRDGLADAVWHARFELLAKEPDVIFDGSHNIQGIAAACASIDACIGGKAVILMGVLSDKDYREMAQMVSKRAKKVFAVTPPSDRALPSRELAELFCSLSVPSTAYDDLDKAVSDAYFEAISTKTPLVMLGSLYMYGEVVKSFEKTQKINKKSEKKG